MRISKLIRQANYTVGEKLRLEMTRVSLYSSSSSTMKDITKVMTVEDVGPDFVYLLDENRQGYRSDNRELHSLHGRWKGTGKPFRFEVNKITKI